MAYVHRIAVDEVPLHLLDMRRYRRVAVGLRIRFSPAGDAFVRLDLHVYEILADARMECESGYFRDLHWDSSAVVAIR
jgi:hypothetical protein